ncbi:MAG TPA: nucleoside monophosphate kinase [Actinomycetota bacterium]|nr:nucleoside monophosphate kinase [Actinomycetota bacterium]
MASHDGSGGHELRRLVMLGPPASGKGTQGKRLAAQLGIPHVSTGALLRRTIDDGDPLGVAGLIADGKRVSDEIVEQVLEPALGDAFLLDGYPRTAEQAARLDELLAGRALDRAVELVADKEILVCRMMLRADAEQRTDDSPEVFLRRLNDYLHEEPAIRGHYAGRITSIDSSGAPNEVYARMLEALGLAPVRV